MVTRPTRGTTHPDGPDCDQEAQIAAWLEADPAPEGDPGNGEESTCTACGYSGDMTVDGSGPSCPACGVVLIRFFEDTPRVLLEIKCPGCRRKVGVTAEDEGRTVICPGCSYFLGTPLEKPRSRRPR